MHVSSREGLVVVASRQYVISNNNLYKVNGGCLRQNKKRSFSFSGCGEVKQAHFFGALNNEIAFEPSPSLRILAYQASSSFIKI